MEITSEESSSEYEDMEFTNSQRINKTISNRTPASFRTIKLSPGTSVNRFIKSDANVTSKSKVEDSARLQLSKFVTKDKKTVENVAEYKIVDDKKRVAKFVYVKNDNQYKKKVRKPSIRMLDKPSTIVRPEDEIQSSETKLSWGSSFSRSELNEILDIGHNIKKVNPTPSTSKIYTEKITEEYLNNRFGLKTMKKSIAQKLNVPSKSKLAHNDSSLLKNMYVDLESKINYNLIEKGNKKSNSNTKDIMNVTPNVTEVTDIRKLKQPQSINKTRLIKIDKSKLIPLSSITKIKEPEKPKPKVQILEHLTFHFKSPTKKLSKFIAKTHNAPRPPKKFTFEKFPQAKQKVIVEKITQPDLESPNVIDTEEIIEFENTNDPEMNMNFGDIDLKIALENDIIIFPNENIAEGVDENLVLGLENIIINPKADDAITTQTDSNNSLIEDNLDYSKYRDVLEAHDSQENNKRIENQKEVASLNVGNDITFNMPEEDDIKNQENSGVSDFQNYNEILENQENKLIDTILNKEVNLTEEVVLEEDENSASKDLVNIECRGGEGQYTIKESGIDSENNTTLNLDIVKNQILVEHDESGNKYVILMPPEEDEVFSNEVSNSCNKENVHDENDLQANQEEIVRTNDEKMQITIKEDMIEEEEEFSQHEDQMIEEEITHSTEDEISHSTEEKIIQIAEDEMIQTDEEEMTQTLETEMIESIQEEIPETLGQDLVLEETLVSDDVLEAEEVEIVTESFEESSPDENFLLEAEQENNEVQDSNLLGLHSFNDNSVSSSESLCLEDAAENNSIENIDTDVKHDNATESSIDDNESSELNESFETVGDNEVSSDETEDETLEIKLTNTEDTKTVSKLNSTNDFPTVESKLDEMEDEEDEIPSPIYEKITKNEIKESVTNCTDFFGFIIDNTEIQMQYKLWNIKKLSEDIANLKIILNKSKVDAQSPPSSISYSEGNSGLRAKNNTDTLSSIQIEKESLRKPTSQSFKSNEDDRTQKIPSYDLIDTFVLNNSNHILNSETQADDDDLKNVSPRFNRPRRQFGNKERTNRISEISLEVTALSPAKKENSSTKKEDSSLKFSVDDHMDDIVNKTSKYEQKTESLNRRSRRFNRESKEVFMETQELSLNSVFTLDSPKSQRSPTQSSKISETNSPNSKNISPELPNKMKGRGRQKKNSLRTSKEKAFSEESSSIQKDQTDYSDNLPDKVFDKNKQILNVISEGNSNVDSSIKSVKSQELNLNISTKDDSKINEELFNKEPTAMINRRSLRSANENNKVNLSPNANVGSKRNSVSKKNQHEELEEKSSQNMLNNPVTSKTGTGEMVTNNNTEIVDSTKDDNEMTPDQSFSEILSMDKTPMKSKEKRSRKSKILLSPKQLEDKEGISTGSLTDTNHEVFSKHQTRSMGCKGIDVNEQSLKTLRSPTRKNLITSKPIPEGLQSDTAELHLGEEVNIRKSNRRRKRSLISKETVEDLKDKEGKGLIDEKDQKLAKSNERTSSSLINDKDIIDKRDILPENISKDETIVHENSKEKQVKRSRKKLDSKPHEEVTTIAGESKKVQEQQILTPNKMSLRSRKEGPVEDENISLVNNTSTQLNTDEQVLKEHASKPRKSLRCTKQSEKNIPSSEKSQNIMLEETTADALKHVQTENTATLNQNTKQSRKSLRWQIREEISTKVTPEFNVKNQLHKEIEKQEHENICNESNKALTSSQEYQAEQSDKKENRNLGKLTPTPENMIHSEPQQDVLKSNIDNECSENQKGTSLISNTVSNDKFTSETSNINFKKSFGSLEDIEKKLKTVSRGRKAFSSQLEPKLQKKITLVTKTKDAISPKRRNLRSRKESNSPSIENNEDNTISTPTTTEVFVKIPLPLISNSTKIEKILESKEDVDLIPESKVLETKVQDTDFKVQDSMVSSANPVEQKTLNPNITTRKDKKRKQREDSFDSNQVLSKTETRKSLRSSQVKSEIKIDNVLKSSMDSNDAQSPVQVAESSTNKDLLKSPLNTIKDSKASNNKRKSNRLLTEVEPSKKLLKDDDKNSSDSNDDNIVLADYKLHNIKKIKDKPKDTPPRNRLSRLVKEVESLYPAYEVPNATAALSKRKVKNIKTFDEPPKAYQKRRSLRNLPEEKVEKDTVSKLSNANDKLGDISKDWELICNSLNQNSEEKVVIQNQIKTEVELIEDDLTPKKSLRSNISLRSKKEPAIQIFEEVDETVENGKNTIKIEDKRSPQKPCKMIPDENISLSRINPALKTYERKRKTDEVRMELADHEIIDVDKIKKEKPDEDLEVVSKETPSDTLKDPRLSPAPLDPLITTIKIEKNTTPTSTRNPSPTPLKIDANLIPKTEEPDDNGIFKNGDLVYARLGNYPYWPCLVTKEPFTDRIVKSCLKEGKTKWKMYHVRFFGDRGRRSWIHEKRLLLLNDINDLSSMYEKLKKECSNAVAQPYFIPMNLKKAWDKGMKEALSLKDKTLEERYDFFFNQFASKKEKLERQKKEIEFYKSLAEVEKALNIKNKTAPKEILKEEKVSSSESGSSSPVIPQPSTPKRSFFGNSVANENSTPVKLFKTKAEEESLHEAEFKDGFKISKTSSHTDMSETSTSDTDSSSKCSTSSQKKITTETQKTLYKRNNVLFNKSLNGNRVCQVCLKPGDIFKCRGKCFGYFHQLCINSKSPKENSKNPKTEFDVEIIEIDDDDPPEIIKRTDKSFQTLPIGEKIDETLKAVMESIQKQNIYDYEGKVKSEAVLDDEEIIQHVTGDDIIIKKDFKCQKCIANIKPECFACGKDINSKNTSMRKKCNVPGCGKFYHLDCLKSWPQTQYHIGQMIQDDHDSSAFSCPLHVCHTCVSDQPGRSTPLLLSNKIFRCVKCPATYHNSINCIPAGTDVLSSTQIICPRHFYLEQGKTSKEVINITWCFICNEGGNLICCDNCPTSIHPECGDLVSNNDDSYICEECQSGRLPLYDEIVWVKMGTSRWWPALILLPNEVPKGMLDMPHLKGEFVVEFYGSHEHFWVGSGRVFIYQDGDQEERLTAKKKKIDFVYDKAVEEAVIAHSIKTEFKKKLKESMKSDNKPPPYKKIKANRPVGNVKVYDGNISLTNPCTCSPDDENPCGSESDCLNRLLMTECSPKTCPAGENCQNQCFEKRHYPAMEPYKTQGRGWGLKTLEFIKKGRFVVEYVGEVIDDQEYQRRIEKMHEQKDDNYYFLTIDTNRMIDAGPKGNLSRFMNHCCEPNCETQKWTVNGDTRVGLFALKDISKDTELTFNYNLQCIGEEKKTCHCGAEICTGFLGAKHIDEKKAKKQLDKSKSKKKSVSPAPIEPCFICGKCDEPTYECPNKMCSKFYHMNCINLNCKPESKWSCPWHNCTTCSKRTIRCCTKCLNSYCPSHSEGNIRYDKLLGFVCHEHDPNKESQILSQSVISSHTELNVSTEEGDITSTTTVDETVKNSTVPKPDKVKNQKKRKRESQPLERPTKILKSSLNIHKDN